MNTHVYCVHFIKPNIKAYIPAALGEIAVEIAVKKLEAYGIDADKLKCKINYWRVK